MSVHTFCTKNGASPEAVISRRERKRLRLFSRRQRVNASWQKWSSLRGTAPHGWSFTWINARAETTLLSLPMQWRTLCFWAFRRTAEKYTRFVWLGHARIGRRCGWIRGWTEKREDERKREKERKGKSPFRHWGSWTLRQGHGGPSKPFFPFICALLYIPQVLDTEN